MYRENVNALSLRSLTPTASFVINLKIVAKTIQKCSGYQTFPFNTQTFSTSGTSCTRVCTILSKIMLKMLPRYLEGQLLSQKTTFKSQSSPPLQNQA
jgi:hypothetical protein